MTNRPMKRCSAAQITKETTIKRTAEYCPTPVRLYYSKGEKILCWQGCEHIGSFLHCQWACKMVQSSWKTVLRFLPLLQIEQPHDTPIALLGLHPKGMKPGPAGENCTALIVAALLIITQTQRNTPVSRDRCVHVEKLVRASMEFHSP